jgi:hypothetical protein
MTQALISLQTYLGVPCRGAGTHMYIGRRLRSLLSGQLACLPVSGPDRVLFFQLVA